MRVPLQWLSEEEKSLSLLQDTYKHRYKLEQREMSQGDELTLKKQSLTENQEFQPAIRGFFRMM